MIPVSLAVIPEGAPALTLGGLLGPLGALILVAGLVTVSVLVVGLVNAHRHVPTATSHWRDRVMRAASILVFITVSGIVTSAGAA